MLHEPGSARLLHSDVNPIETPVMAFRVLQPFPVRLAPGADLRDALMALLPKHGMRAAFVVSGIGSLRDAHLRFAGRPTADLVAGDLELLTLAGSLSPDGPHLHATVADASGRVVGGHVAPGCRVRTTCEVLVALLPGHRFARRPDPVTGYPELEIDAD